MELYEISNDYVDFLSTYDNKVQRNEVSGFKRKYIGFIVLVDNMKYLLPLSSAKQGSDFIVIGKDKYGFDFHKLLRKRVSVPLIYITEKDAEGNLYVLSKIKINSMIPVFDGSSKFVTKVNISDEANTNYKNLLHKELNFVRANEEKIIKNAKILYQQKLAERNDLNYIKVATPDFRLLEEKCKEWDSSH